MGNPKTTKPRTTGSFVRPSPTCERRPFVIGGRCCVRYKKQNVFGVYTETWFLGTVVGLTSTNHKKGLRISTATPSEIIKSPQQSKTSTTAAFSGDWKIKVHFEDGSEGVHTYRWPNKEQNICAIREEIVDGYTRYYYGRMYDISGREIKEEYICDLRPDNLRIGDVVFAYFQNGNLLSEKQHGWHRGLVASVREQNGTMLCDVLYDDRDFERGIPFGKGQHGNVICMQQKQTKPTWIEGLPVPVRSDRWNFIKRGTVKRTLGSDTSDEAAVEILYKQGIHTLIERKSYEMVLKSMFNAKVVELRKEQDAHPQSNFFYSWPSVVIIECFKTDPKEQSQDEFRNEDCNTEALLGAPSTLAKRKNEAATLPPCSKKYQKNGSTSVAAVLNSKDLNVKLPAESRSDQIQFSAYRMKHCDSDSDSGEHGDEEQNKKPVELIDPSLGRILMENISSQQRSVGIDQLKLLVNLNGLVPDNQLCTELVDLVVYGPGSHGNYFPDTSCMQDICDLIQSLLKATSKAEVIVPSVTAVLGMDISAVFFTQMSARYYMKNRDDRHVTPTTITRIGQTMHAKACFAEIYVQLLEHALSSSINGNSYASHARNCLLVRSLREFPKSFPGALEKSIEISVSLWLSFGHLLVGDHIALERFAIEINTISEDIMSFATTQVRRLLQLMGKVITYIAWLYYQREGKTDIMLVADFISRSIQNHFEGNDIDSFAFESKMAKQEYLKTLMFQFLLQLQNRTLPYLVPSLAKRLNLVTEYNVVFGTNPSER